MTKERKNRYDVKMASTKTGTADSKSDEKDNFVSTKKIKGHAERYKERRHVLKYWVILCLMAFKKKD